MHRSSSSSCGGMSHSHTDLRESHTQGPIGKGGEGGFKAGLVRLRGCDAGHGC